MNAWGFRPTVWPQLDDAVRDGLARGDAETLLPSVIAGLVPDATVEVCPVDDRCLSVTWASDLAPLQREMAALVDAGVYPRYLGSPPR
jgi:hypothetical protein